MESARDRSSRGDCSRTLPAKSGRIDHIGIENVENDTLDRVTESGERERLVLQSGGRSFTDNGVASRTQEAGVSDHECLCVSPNSHSNASGGTYHLEACLNPFRSPVALHGEHGSGPNDEEIHSAVYESPGIDGPPSKMVE